MKRGLTILLIAAMLAVSAFCFISCKDKVEIPDGVELSIMSFNIRQDTSFDVDEKDWEFRKEYVVNHIKEQAPAILGMQEVQKNQYEYISESLDNYETIWYSRATNESQEGLAIAYDKDTFELVSEDMFWLSETPDVESKGFGASYLRICVHAILKEKSSQKEISVYCAHLEVRGSKTQVAEIELIKQRIEENDKDRECIVLGDFNSTADSKAFEALSQTMKSTQDTAIWTEYGISYQDFGGKLVTYDKTIDFIFVSPSVFVKRFDILQETKNIDGKTIYYSDHYAIKSEIILVG